MGERQTVAQGQYDDGISWLVWAERGAPGDGQPDAELLTMIRVTDVRGRVLREGGAGGPALGPGQLMNVSTGGGDEGPYCILARVHPDIGRVTVTTDSGETMTAPVYDAPDFPEVRFAVLLVPRDLRLAAVTGLCPDGRQLERFDLGFHQRFWHQRR